MTYEIKRLDRQCQVSILVIFTHCNINLNLTEWLKFTRNFNFMTRNAIQRKIPSKRITREEYICCILFSYTRNVAPKNKKKLFFSFLCSLHSSVHWRSDLKLYNRHTVGIKKFKFQQFQNFIFCKISQPIFSLRTDRFFFLIYRLLVYLTAMLTHVSPSRYILIVIDFCTSIFTF